MIYARDARLWKGELEIWPDRDRFESTDIFEMRLVLPDVIPRQPPFIGCRIEKCIFSRTLSNEEIPKWFSNCAIEQCQSVPDIPDWIYSGADK